jgi:uncharacterized protein YdiU (UPF0061 family)
MATDTQQMESRRSVLSTVLFAAVVLAAIVIVSQFAYMGLTAGGTDTAAAQQWWWLQTLSQVLGFLLIPLLVIGLILVGRTVMAISEASETIAGNLERVESLLGDQGENIRNMNNLACLSDQTKSLIYHEHEIEALRETVNAMLLRQDYKSAEALVARMESRLGLVDEASRIRKEIEELRKASVDEKISAALDRIDQILQRREWAQAKREAERVLTLFPDNPKVKQLPRRIQDAWNAYKRKLLKEYGEAVKINDVERSVDLLKELDKYLTPQEGAAMAESARGVFKAKLHNLGVQFAIAVTDQNWSAAVSTGEEIIREFPNSRMAREAREKLDLLRAYAAGTRQPPSPFIGGPGMQGMQQTNVQSQFTQPQQ